MKAEIWIPGEDLFAPMTWRSERLVTVCTSGLYGAASLAAVFGVMAACPRHTFHVITKNDVAADGVREWMADAESDPARTVADALLGLGWEELSCHVANVVNGWSRWRGQPDDGPLDGSMRRWPLRNVEVYAPLWGSK